MINTIFFSIGARQGRTADVNDQIGVDDQSGYEAMAFCLRLWHLTGIWVLTIIEISWKTILFKVQLADKEEELEEVIESKGNDLDLLLNMNKILEDAIGTKNDD